MVCKNAQEIGVASTKPYDASLIQWDQNVEGKDRLLEVILRPVYVSLSTYTHTQSK